jgi:hypothetical protein
MARCILRLEEAKIHKKYEWLNTAEVKFYSFAADQNLTLPELDRVMAAADPGNVREHIRAAAVEILQRWEGVTVCNVRKNHRFSFGDTGKVVYDAPSMPHRLDWLLLAVEIDRDIRSLASHIDAILPNDQVDTIAARLSAFIRANPGAAHIDAARALGKLLVRSVTYFMKKNENDQVGLVEQSFVREIDFPTGRRCADDVQDLTGNMWYTYTLLADESL